MKTRLVSVVVASAAALALQSIGTAQLRHHDSLTNWQHLGGPPAWNDNVADNTAEFGVVDELVSIGDLQYTSGQITLAAGMHVARIRVMKLQDTTGAAPLDFTVTFGGNAETVQLPVADQAVDRWVHTPSLLFKLPSQTQVTFTLSNRDTAINKQNYRFDSAKVGFIDIGDVVLHESFVNWGHSWNDNTHWQQDPVFDNRSALGYVDHLNMVWWFDARSPQYLLPAGTFTANLRAELVSGGTAHALDFIVDLPNGVSHTVTYDVNFQVPDRFTYTPNLVFTMDQPGFVRFRLWDITSGQLKSNYNFDAVSVRPGGFNTLGDGCPSSLGETRLGGQPPYVGSNWFIRAFAVPSIAVFAFGVTNPNLDMTGFGAPMCFLFASPDIFSPPIPANARNRATLQITVPLDLSLIGARWMNQALIPDPGHNQLGVVSSDGVEISVGPPL